MKPTRNPDSSKGTLILSGLLFFLALFLPRRKPSSPTHLTTPAPEPVLSIADPALIHVNVVSGPKGFGAPNWIASVGLAVVVWQTFVYLSQLDEMRKATEAATEATKAAQEGVKLTQESLKLTRESNASATTQYQSDQRAWVTVLNATFISPPKAGEITKIKVNYGNSGKTPASINVSVQLSWHLNPVEGGIPVPPVISDYEISDNSRIFVIAPGASGNSFPSSSRPISQEELDDMIENRACLQVRGLITYEDVFGKPHRTNFSLYASGPQVIDKDFNFFLSDSGNSLE